MSSLRSTVRDRPRVGVLAAAAAFGVMVVALFAGAFVLSQGEVVAEGRFVESVDHDVARMRLFDRFTIYTDETFAPLTSDLATTLVLIALAGMALLAFVLVLQNRPSDHRLQLFFLCTAAGATLFAFDEQMELVDSLGYNIEALYVPDLLVYAPPVAVYAFTFRGILVSSRRAMAALGAGAAMFALAQGFDRLPHDRFESIEEKLEALATVPMALGILLLALHFLADEPAVQRPSAEKMESSGTSL